MAQPGETARGRPPLPEVIVREAIRLFGEKSYPVVGMRDLSKAVGVQPGSLYAHISSKEALLMLIVEQGITRYNEAVTAARDSVSGADLQLREMIRAHMRVLAGSIEQSRITFSQWHYLGPENRATVIAMRQQYEDAFVLTAQEGIRAGVIRPVPHLKATLLGVIGGLSVAADWYDPAKPETPEGIADAISDVLLHGLVAR